MAHPSRVKELILQNALKEIRKLLVELEKDGKDLRQVRLRNFRRTHFVNCVCTKCKRAEQAGDPNLRGLRELGFKVFFHEEDPEE